METQQPLRIRLLFEDPSVLSQSQRSEGMNRSWLLIEPLQHRKISDVCNHLLHTFNLSNSCPNGILLFMDGFVLPSSESTRILKDNEVICVQRKEIPLAEAIEPVENGMLLLANEEFDKESGGYQSESGADDEFVTDEIENANNGESLTRKTTSKKMIKPNEETNKEDAETSDENVKSSPNVKWSKHLQDNVEQASTAPPDGAKKGSDGYYDATLTIRARISIARDIQVKLSDSPRRLELFRSTCFGPWLDVQATHGDPMLVHLILQTQLILEESQASDEMRFRIGGHDLRFGPEEFCLITGLRFGPTRVLSERSDNPFRDRIFPNIPAGTSVKGSDVLHIFNKSLNQIADLDAVRICLLILLEVGFVGREKKLVVDDDLLRLVEDLDSWNTFPWGSYIWAVTYQQLIGALPRRAEMHTSFPATKVAKYSLTGFIWAFKIWIFEVFPVALKFATRESDVIPRAIAWRRKCVITWDLCQTFLDVKREECQPRQPLTPTPAERSTDWWKASRRFFDGVVDDFLPLAKKARFALPPRSAKMAEAASTLCSGQDRDTSWSVSPNGRATTSEDRHHHHADDIANTTMHRSDTTTNHHPMDERMAVMEKGQRLMLEDLRRLEERISVVTPVQEIAPDFSKRAQRLRGRFERLSEHT